MIHGIKGKHVVADFYGTEITDNPIILEEIMTGAVKAAGATPIKFSYHKFMPQGISAVLILEESHMSIHTWPEQKFIAVDIYTCGESAMPIKAIEHLKKTLMPARVEVLKLTRGVTPIFKV